MRSGLDAYRNEHGTNHRSGTATSERRQLTTITTTGGGIVRRLADPARGGWQRGRWRGHGGRVGCDPSGGRGLGGAYASGRLRDLEERRQSRCCEYKVDPFLFRTFDAPRLWCDRPRWTTAARSSRLEPYSLVLLLLYRRWINGNRTFEFRGLHVLNGNQDVGFPLDKDHVSSPAWLPLQ